MTTKSQFEKAKTELVKNGWVKVASVMTDGPVGLRYGSHFSKEGKDFFLNKDTYMVGFTGDQMATICDSIFN